MTIGCSNRWLTRCEPRTGERCCAAFETSGVSCLHLHGTALLIML